MKWQPGQSGNPNGRPKKARCLTHALTEYGKRSADATDGQKATLQELLVKTLWNLALSGDLAAIRYIFDRIDGKPIETMIIPGMQQSSGKIKIVWVSSEGEEEKEEKEEKEATNEIVLQRAGE